jgi:hypothetical protein
MQQIIKKLWESYNEVTPSINKIKLALDIQNNEIFNDHIAFRSIQYKDYGLNKISDIFKKNGYEKKKEYYFKEKKLKAVHLENTSVKKSPRIFISELLIHEFSSYLKNSLLNSIQKLNPKKNNMLTAGRKWIVNYSVYKALLKESEYAAWIYVHGYRVNHFTLNVNDLPNYSILKLCEKLKKEGFLLNNSGKTIKGETQEGLQQASTMADKIPIYFEDLKATISIPSCYVEFAERYPIRNKLFGGFLVKSANKIFESTNLKLQQ